MAYCQNPFESSSAHSFYRKLCATRELFCSSGLKDGVCFNDVDKRVFHSTYRATHHVMASITQILPLDGSGRVNSPPNTEKSSQLEESIVEPEISICIADGAQHKVHNCVQTSIGCIDSQMEQENFDGCDTPTILHPEAPPLLSRAPLQNGQPSNRASSEGVGNPTALDLHISYLDIQEPYGLSELHIAHPEASSTPDLQPEVKFWDFEGNGNLVVKDSFCTMENVCIDNDERESLVLEENSYMSACAGSFSTERVDVKESFCTVVNAHINDNNDSGHLSLEEEDIISACMNDSFCTLIDVGISEYNNQESPVLEENDIMSACIGGFSAESYESLMRESRVVCTGFNSLYISSYTSFDCWKDAKTNHRSKLSPCRWYRIRKVPNHVEISSPNIWHTFTMKRLSFRSLPTSRFRLTLQELVKLLKQRSIDWKVSKQLMAYSNIYLRVCRSKHLSARGRRAVGKADARRDGDYKKVNVRIIFQDDQKCHSKGRRNRVSGNCLPPEHNSLRIEQADQYASIPPSKVVIDSALKLYCFERSPRSIEPSSDGVSETLKGSLKHGEWDQSGNNLFPEASSDSTSKVPNLVEGRDGAMTRESSLQEMDEFVEDSRKSSGFSSQSVTDVDDWTSVPADQVNECLLEVRDGGMACSRESLEQEMVEFKEDIQESCGFSSLMSVNEVDDWTSVPADQVDECLDTCLYSLQRHPTCSRHDFTPELKPSDPVLVRNPVKPANSAIDGFNDEGSPIFHVHANANKTNDLRSSMPNGGVHEKRSKKNLEHFAEGFLLRRHIRRQQRRAQQAPPYPPRDSAGYVLKNLGLNGKPLAEVKPNPYITCSIEDNNDATRNLTSSTTDNDCSVGADVVIDIVGLIAYEESQYKGLATTYLSNYTDTPLLGGQVVNINIGAVIVTIIAIVVYTRTLLEGGLAWVGARTQKGEDN